MSWGGNKSSGALLGHGKGGLQGFFFLFGKGKSTSRSSLRTELKQELRALRCTGKMLLAKCPKALVFKLSLLGSFALCFLLFSLLSKAWCSQA